MSDLRTAKRHGTKHHSIFLGSSLLLALVASLPAGAQRFNAPRTPWGDPDLQGTFANDNEYATPLEKPAEFGDKTLADITPAEFERIRKEAEAKMIANLPPGPRGPAAGHRGSCW